jgi:hypothetical protein
MKIFGQIVRTVVNVAALPVEVVRDVVTLGGIVTEEDKPYTIQRLEQLKKEASE